MKYWLLLQVVASWPASPPQMQFLGPLPDPVICQQRADEIGKTFAGIKILCVAIPDGSPAPAAPQAGAAK